LFGDKKLFESDSKDVTLAPIGLLTQVSQIQKKPKDEVNPKEAK
jgi:hypothetical protein